MDCMGILSLLEKLLFCVVLVCVLVCGRKGISLVLKSLVSPYLLLYGVEIDNGRGYLPWETLIFVLYGA